MAISFEYTVRETAGNLWRNRVMSFAAVLTIAVSLALGGAALLIKQGVAAATQQWKGGVQMLIFMQPSANTKQYHSINTQLRQLASVSHYDYVNKSTSYEEFRRYFANQPDLLNSVTKAQIPPYYGVVLKDPAEAPQVANIFNGQPGVKKVDFNFSAIHAMINASSVAQAVIIGLAVILLISAMILILNIIRIAIFSRRTEVQIMKFVGATDWFIRIPYMLEGFTQGLVGALFAAAGVLGIRSLFNYLIGHFHISLLNGFILTSHDVFLTEIVVFVVGLAVGTLGSALAVRRYLDV